MNKNFFRKAAIFTVLSVLMSSLILISFFSSIEMPADSGVDQVKLRVSLTNYYVQQSDNYVRNALLSSSRHTFEGIIDHMVDVGMVSDFDEEFRSCIISDTSTQIPDCPDGSYIRPRIEIIEDFLEENLDIDFNINVYDIDVFQDELSGPWHIRVRASFNVTAFDGYANWISQRTVSHNFDIRGLRDPVYPNSYPNNVSFNDSLSVFLVGPPSTLNEIVKQRHYFQYDKAPSFLDRLRGDYGHEREIVGIVSVLSPLAVAPPSQDLNHLDFVYYQGLNCRGYPFVRIDFDDDFGHEHIQGAIIPEDMLGLVNISPTNTQTVTGTGC